MSDDAWRRQGRDEDEDFGPPLFGDVPTTEVKPGDLSFGDADTGSLPHWTEPPTGEVPRVRPTASNRRSERRPRRVVVVLRPVAGVERRRPQRGRRPVGCGARCGRAAAARPPIRRGGHSVAGRHRAGPVAAGAPRARPDHHRHRPHRFHRPPDAPPRSPGHAEPRSPRSSSGTGTARLARRRAARRAGHAHGHRRRRRHRRRVHRRPAVAPRSGPGDRRHRARARLGRVLRQGHREGLPAGHDRRHRGNDRDAARRLLGRRDGDAARARAGLRRRVGRLHRRRRRRVRADAEHRRSPRWASPGSACSARSPR